MINLKSLFNFLFLFYIVITTGNCKKLSAFFSEASTSEEAAYPGNAAPDFTLTDITGKEHQLSQYQGKYIVLEWINFDCPYVEKHYNSGNMQNLQKKYTAQGVVWLTINSSAPGKQGNFTINEIKNRSAKLSAQYSAYLLDTAGKVGRTYEAQTTPHMYIIDPEGELIYQGAIDSISSTDEKDIPNSINYVALALDEAQGGKPLTHASTVAYGCSVKY